MMQAFQNTKLSMIYLLTNFGGALVYMGGAAGILAMVYF